MYKLVKSEVWIIIIIIILSVFSIHWFFISSLSLSKQNV